MNSFNPFNQMNPFNQQNQTNDLINLKEIIPIDQYQLLITQNNLLICSTQQCRIVNQISLNNTIFTQPFKWHLNSNNILSVVSPQIVQFFKFNYQSFQLDLLHSFNNNFILNEQNNHNEMNNKITFTDVSIHNNIILFSTTQGEIFVYSFPEMKLMKRFQLITSSILHMKFDERKMFLFVIDVTGTFIGVEIEHESWRIKKTLVEEEIEEFMLNPLNEKQQMTKSFDQFSGSLEDMDFTQMTLNLSFDLNLNNNLNNNSNNNFMNNQNNNLNNNNIPQEIKQLHYNKQFDQNVIKMKLTENSCCIIINGYLLEYQYYIPSLYLYQKQQINDVKLMNKKMVIATQNELIICEQCQEKNIIVMNVIDTLLSRTSQNDLFSNQLNNQQNQMKYTISFSDEIIMKYGNDSMNISYNKIPMDVITSQSLEEFNIESYNETNRRNAAFQSNFMGNSIFNLNNLFTPINQMNQNQNNSMNQSNEMKEETKSSQTKKKTYLINYNSMKATNNQTLQSIKFMNEKDIFGLDKNGLLHHAQINISNNRMNIETNNDMNIEMKPFKEVLYQQKTIRNNQSIVITPHLLLIPNQPVCLFTFGNELQLFNLQEKQVITTIYSPEKIPEDSVSCLEMFYLNNYQHLMIGLQNGNILHVDFMKKSISQLYKHETSILSIKVMNNYVFSLSQDGQMQMYQLNSNNQNNQQVIPIKSFKIAEKPLSMEIYSNYLLLNESERIVLYSLESIFSNNSNQIQELKTFETTSLIIKSQFSSDGKFIICLTKERIYILETNQLNICTFIVVRSLQRELKISSEVFDLDVSKTVPCQFVLSFVGGYVMLIQPNDYNEWI